MSSIETIVLFGATGDLARKMLLPALYRLEEHQTLEQRIVGIALDDWSKDRFIRHAAAAVRDAIADTDEPTLERLIARFEYVPGDYTDDATFDRLAAAVDGSGACLSYLAIPPSLFETVTNGLASSGLLSDGRLLVEKPFARDRTSARHLNDVLHRVVDETAIYRIDHFLGKEPVENILVFRYANPVIDAVWSRHYIERIEITMSEAFGVEDRGALYDSLGVVRDVVQNHLLQVLSLLTMEAPVNATADAYSDERVKVLRAACAPAPREVVFGQYAGYRDVPGVAPDSMTATYVSLTLSIDSPRWFGVPISIRAGKGLDATVTTAEVVFRTSPPIMFAPESRAPAPNRLVFRIGPGDGMDLLVQTKRPGDGLELTTTALTVDYDRVFGRIPMAYERILHDALVGDRSQFAREDVVEEAWRIVDAIVDPGVMPVAYPMGSPGPAAS